MVTNKKPLITTIIIGVLVISLGMGKINQPFWGHHEFNGVFYGMIAKNYLRYGLGETRGGQVNTFPVLPKSQWQYHTHHPSTYPLLLSGWFKVFGVSETNARLLSLLSSAVGLAGLSVLNILVFGYVWSAIAIIPVLLTPLLFYYNSMPVFEPLLLPFIGWGLVSYWHYRNNQIDIVTPWFCFAAFLLDWPGFWLAFWLVTLELLTKKRTSVVISLILASSLAGTIIFFHQWIISGSVEPLLNALIQRAKNSTLPFTYADWTKTLVSRIKAFWGLPIIFVSFVSTSYLLGNRNQKAMLILCILGMGLSHILVFRVITWYHDYMLYHVIPFVTLTIGAFITLCIQKFRAKHWQLALILSLLAVTTVNSTWQFTQALMNMKPHYTCVEFGKKLAQSPTLLTFNGTQEEITICPPFIGYYGEKNFRVKKSD